MIQAIVFPFPRKRTVRLRLADYRRRYSRFWSADNYQKLKFNARNVVLLEITITQNPSESQSRNKSNVADRGQNRKTFAKLANSRNRSTTARSYKLKPRIHQFIDGLVIISVPFCDKNGFWRSTPPHHSLSTN